MLVKVDPWFYRFMKCKYNWKLPENTIIISFRCTFVFTIYIICQILWTILSIIGILQIQLNLWCMSLMIFQCFWQKYLDVLVHNFVPSCLIFTIQLLTERWEHWLSHGRKNKMHAKGRKCRKCKNFTLQK